MKKNDILNLTIENVGEGGEGVAKVDGFTLFVPFAMIGEEVEAKIILLKKSFGVAKIIKIIKKSKERISPLCPHFEKCGGCQIMHMSDKAKKVFKRQKVVEVMQRIAFLDVDVEQTFCGEHLLRYRNKLQLPISTNSEGDIVGGFYAQFSHRIIATDDCLLQKKDSMRAYAIIKDFMKENGVSAYSEQTKKGLIRHIVARSTYTQILITIVINGDSIPKSKVLLEKLKELGKPFGLYININKKVTNVIMSEKYIHIGGLEYLTIEEEGLVYDVLPQSFLQVNDEVKKALYQQAINLANLNENDVVVNAYSGAGLLTAYFAKKAKHAYGIEIIKEATQAADVLAEKNGLLNKMTNITGDCKEQLAMLIPKLEKGGDQVVFVLDPPRKGVDKEILLEIKRLKPKKIVYISCNPSTLARDLGILMGTLEVCENGVKKAEIVEKSLYKLSKLTPFDMFPQTKHVECVVGLELVD